MNVYEHFACHTVLPVRLSDIRDHILESCDVHEIIRYGVDIDPNILRGALRLFRHRPPYASDDIITAHIVYSKHLDEEYQRIVCCKEMLHLANGHEFTARTADQVTQLIEQIVLPIEAARLPAVQDDHAGVLRALTVLLPRDAIARLKELEVPAEDVAIMARVPLPYAKLAMSKHWERVLDSI